jgi:hypothetical protein
MVFTPGNALSVLVFFVWVPFALWAAKRWPAAKAAAWLSLLPIMFLPERVEFDLPVFPSLKKAELGVFWALVATFLFHRQRFRALRLGLIYKACFTVLLLGYCVTILTNTSPIVESAVYLRPHQPTDLISAVIWITLSYILPFVLGAAIFRTPRDLRVLFRVLVIATMIYGVLQLVEVRLSPKLNLWTYGFFQHSFAQMRRAGGFRPIVYMSHGLVVAMFTLVGIVAAAMLHKSKTKTWKLSSGVTLGFLSIVTILNKGVAAMVYAFVAVPLVLFASPKTQMRVAVVIAVLVLSYPVLRSLDLVPVDTLYETATEQFAEERAESLMTRFVNEKMLLERALERPLFGWGTYGRPFIYSPKSGKKITIADGDWIITLGTSGYVGFLSKYLLLLLPIFFAARQMKNIPRESDRRYLAALSLIMAFSTLDLIPNSTSHYLPFVLSGALLGCSLGIAELARKQRLARILEARKRANRAPALQGVAPAAS